MTIDLGHYTNAFDHLIEGCQIVDFNWRYIYFNKAAETQSRREKSYLIGKTMMEAYPGIQDTEVYLRISECLRDRTSSRFENRFEYPDRSIGYFIISIQPVADGALIFSYDITGRVEAERQLVQMKRLYSTLSQVNQTVVRVRQRDILFRSICQIAVQYGQFAIAWIGTLDEKSGDVIPVAAEGIDLSTWRFEKVNIHHGNQRNTQTAESIRTSSVITSEDVRRLDANDHLKRQLAELPYRSAASLPLRQGNKIIGVLNLISEEQGFFKSVEEIQLLQEMSLDISFALDSIEMERVKQQ